MPMKIGLKIEKPTKKIWQAFRKISILIT